MDEFVSYTSNLDIQFESYHGMINRNEAPLSAYNELARCQNKIGGAVGIVDFSTRTRADANVLTSVMIAFILCSFLEQNLFSNRYTYYSKHFIIFSWCILSRNIDYKLNCYRLH